MNNDQKKIMGVAIAVGLIIIAIFLLKDDKDNPNRAHYAYTIETAEITGCTDSISLLYRDETNDINYYTYCLSNVGIKGEVINDNLVNSFSQGVTINDVMKYLKLDQTIKDGGTKIFIDDGTTGYTNNGITVISCNKIGFDLSSSTINTNDYYIGPKSMTMKDTFCKRKEACNFTRTYNVVNIVDNIDIQYKDVTFKNLNNDQVTIKISNTLLNNIIIGNNVEINFNNNYYTDSSTTLANVFRNTIVSITITDKQGTNQINDVFCPN